MTTPIAIVGIGCRYPDARTPTELWETVVERRQAFRRLPPERLQLDEYYSPDDQAPDRIYSSKAALLTDWVFDRSGFNISRSTYDSTDMSHWLALEVVAAAIRDTGFDLPAETTGVIVGNTLTGDSSRANSLRLRWPYVRRAIGNTLSEDALAEVESRFKDPLCNVTEDTLAGCLSNTIAGRICNYFGFGGGGYAVDGACSSSLLAVIHACNALAMGDLDVAIAGGVDLSLDPFELVGFAKCSALARHQMWVYDRKSTGFIPGEGCGFVVLMRHDESRRQERRAYATIRGWGISSDGRGGMTRPEVSGQRLALRRAYVKAGISIDSVLMFEGHGTGTPVGDAVEVEALSSELREGPHYLGSIKANIGHTKAAAGIAGLLKATLALCHAAIPPITGCTDPLPSLADLASPLRVTTSVLPWPSSLPRRAGVSAMGFGGINTHIVLEATDAVWPSPIPHRASAADVFVFGGRSRDEVKAALARLAALSSGLSVAEVTDAAAAIAKETTGTKWRAAVVASTPDELQRAIAVAEIRQCSGAPRIAFLFSGQGSIPNVRTDFGQTAIVSKSLDALEALRRIGIDAHVAAGHSLGELTALCWAGAIDREQLLDLVAQRGSLMQAIASDGAMAALSCGPEMADSVATGGAVVAALNAANQTVISGPRVAIDQTIERARNRGIAVVLLPVAAAFHSPAMASVAEPLRKKLETIRFRALTRPVFSTVSADWIGTAVSLPELLTTQLTAPVHFAQAINRLGLETDLLIEVGPGSILANLASASGKSAVASDAFPECVASAWMAGCHINVDALFGDRFSRPFDLDRRPLFIRSPCGTAERVNPTVDPPRDESRPSSEPDITLVLRQLLACETELAFDAIRAETSMLSDLHLSSITVARILSEAARQLRMPTLVDSLAFANATVGEIAAAFESLKGHEESPEVGPAEGISDWVRPFHFKLIPASCHVRSRDSEPCWRFYGVDWPEARRVFEQVPGRGIVAVLPRDDVNACVDTLLNCRAIHDDERLVIVQCSSCGGAFARTLHLERPRVSVRIVNIKDLDDAAARWTGIEAQATEDFGEAFYGPDGCRHEARAVLAGADSVFVLDASDVLLVTGGGRGIGFETALHFARVSGVRLELLGRSPHDHQEVSANLKRLQEAGVQYRYIEADVTHATDLKRALAGSPRITAILHAAGNNVPRLIDALDSEAFHVALAPKVLGLRNVIGAVDNHTLRLLITYGSILAQTGMPGEAHYGFANEWLACATSEFASTQPNCRAVCIEWSVWSGLGMGNRLGSIEALRRRGVTPIQPEEAVKIAWRVATSISGPRIMVSGRLGNLTTFRFEEAQPPLLRFVEETKVAVRGVELVTDVRFSERSDPYVLEHAVDGEPLFPATVGMEAMVQAAFATTGERPTRLERVELRRPIIAPREEAVTVRLATLVSDAHVDVVMRSSETGFAVDHFRAVLRDGTRPSPARVTVPVGQSGLDPAWVYETLLFHGTRFRRVSAYRVVTATRCVAEIKRGLNEPWFHRYLPSSFLLGDPALRDAAIHSLQVCVPQAVVLPEAVESIDFFASPDCDAVVVAEEVGHKDGSFIFDVDLVSPDGLVFERWHRLSLRAIRRRERLDALPFPLWAPFLEREIGNLRVRTGKRNGPDVMQDAAAADRPALRRADGKPLFPQAHVSGSTDGDLKLAIAAEYPVGCDLQLVDGQPWRDILAGRDLRLVDVSRETTGEIPPFASARVWSARESLKKLAGNALAPLVLESVQDLQRVNFRSGTVLINTFVLGRHVVAIAQSRPLS